MNTNQEPELLAEMATNGFDVSQIEYNNQWNRFSRIGQNSGKKNCFYRAIRIRADKNTEILICCYGDWKTGEQYLFKSTATGTIEQKKKINEAIQKAKAVLDAEIEQANKKAMSIATEKWQKASFSGLSTYLKRKQIDKLNGSKMLGLNILVPMMDSESNLVGLQTITPKGDKFFLEGQKVKGCFHVIGGLAQLEKSPTAYVVEGFATGCSVKKATNAPVICAFTAGNLMAACESIKKLFPFLKLVICADNDQFTDGNPGKTRGTNCAIRFNAKFTLPEFKDLSSKPTDFNDLHVLEGLDKVREQIEAAAYFRTETPPSSQLAEEFLISQKLRNGSDLFLRSWQEQFYLFNGNKYSQITEGDLFAKIMAFIQNHGEARAKAGTTLANNIIANLKGITNLPAHFQLPMWLDDPHRTTKNFISLENGILNVDKWLKGVDDLLESHSHNFFSTVCLPFSYDPLAQCPKWLKFLSEIQPNQDTQDLLQEWMGLNLVYDTSFCKFVLLIGEGANGKTVFCVVFRSLLGSENVSAVNLEGFDPKRTFLIAATAGKLANIVGELNQLDKAAEGELKKFVAGELMTAERKHEHPFEFLPTARLTFATNVLPRFADATDGLWRRLLLVPFTVQITDETKQDKNLVNPDWWIKSGEMPGIFNWALEGLKRLYERGHFIEPAISRIAKENYRQDANPSRTFLLDNYEMSSTSHLSSKELYEAYYNNLKSEGHNPLSKTQLATEVKRAFPNVALTKNPRRQANGERSRDWIGLCAKV